MKKLKLHRDNPDIQRRMGWIRNHAKELGWKEIGHIPEEAKIRFRRDSESLIDVWYTSMTVCKFTLRDTGGMKPNYYYPASDDAFIELLA